MIKNLFSIGQEVGFVSVTGQDNTPVYKVGVVISIHLGEDNVNIIYVVRRKVNYFSPMLEEVIRFLDETTFEKNMWSGLQDENK